MLAFSQPTRSSRVVVPALLVAAFACGGDSGTDPSKGGRGPIRVISGGGQTDTINATLRQALVVEVRDSTSRLAAGVTVRFTSLGGAYGSTPRVFVAPLNQSDFQLFASDVTDPTGRAKTLVSNWSVAGTALLEVAVPELGVVDTVSFTINPGAPARFVIAPRDTTVPPGSTYALRVSTADRYQNPIAGVAPTFTATGVTVSSTGQVTASDTYGRASIVVKYHELSDSAGVSVMPRIPMVMTRFDNVELINSDGTAHTTLATTRQSSLSPTSVRATAGVVFYQADPYSDAKLWIVEPGQSARPLLPGSTRADAWPRYSLDGAWVYFVRDVRSLWRVHPDGTGLDSLASFDPPRIYSAPAVSPDGRTVALEDRDGLKLIDVATRSTHTLSVTCASPGYSPDGAFIACADPFNVSIMRADGTGQRVVATFGSFGIDPLSGMDWTPDGKWLLANVIEGGALIEVSSGKVLSLNAVSYPAFQAMFVK